MKRFSPRETALLMLPVGAVGALGWWMSKRPPAPNVGTVRFQFHLEAPSTLEAFDGADAVFRVEVHNDDEKNWFLQTYQPYLEWETPSGEVSRNYSFVLSSTTVMHWPVREPVAYQPDLGWSGRMKDVPAGKLRFGLDYVVGPTPSNKTVMLTPPKAFRAAEKWKIDRAKIKPIELRKLPRQPLISLHEVKIKKIDVARALMPAKITGEAVFVLNGVAMNYATSFDSDLHLRELRSLKPPRQSSLTSGFTTRDAPRRRTIEWQVTPNVLTNKIQITGRASAGNRWPLGFEFEPVSFQSAKVGQKLKFKQFPVALPPKLKP